MNTEMLELTGCVVLRPSDELDLLGHISFGEQVDDLLRDGKKRLVIDLELVTYVSMSAARVFLAIQEKARSVHGSVALAEVRDGARVALDAAGALGVLPIFETVQEAVASVEAA
ncbi:MAG: STAS domain-containing protein [Planctomycetota bacterium]|jgi:anti-anti-sigma factor